MCGFAGFVDCKGSFSREKYISIINEMNECIKHRGPDDYGCWVDEEKGICLGHRRLSILDLSKEGHQPMISSTGRFIIIYNGEIYNYKDIQKEIENRCNQKIKWRGHSDTEIMLSSFETFGIENSLKKFNGMFSFVLYDKKENKLFLVRDRLGQKPLYYGLQNGLFLFGSELKSLNKHPSYQFEIDRNSLALFLRHNYVPSPYSIYKNIYKLNPGSYLEIDINKDIRNSIPEPTIYWSSIEVANNGVQNKFNGSEEVIIQQLDSLLKDAVSKRMIADVPLGAFLSGGIDSSLIVSLMQSCSSKPVKTFTIGFTESKYNESQYAKKVADYLSTDHTELFITPNEARDVIPNIPKIYDEPFADSSQIPTFLVSKLASESVKVALTGDAGDELFGGYDRYIKNLNRWKRINSLPYKLRVFLAKILTLPDREVWDKLNLNLDNVLPGKLLGRVSGEFLYNTSLNLSASKFEDIYYQYLSRISNPLDIIKNVYEESDFSNREFAKYGIDDNLDKMMLYDLRNYLTDDILVKLDRASMAVSLEARSPLCDYRIAEFSWKLPTNYKLRNNSGKWVLKKLLYNYVPKKYFERPKMGFGIPIGEWLRGPLKNWAESLIRKERIKEEGFFDEEQVWKIWQFHLQGTNRWESIIWSILMFQAWLEENKNNLG